MRIAMLGSGAVGGYFGARLASAGNDVQFVARGRHLAAIREQGLRVASPLGDVTLPVPATDDPATIGPVDLVFVGVKTWQLAAALEALPHLVAPATVVIPLLNGVEAADLIAASIGRAHVLKGLCRIIAYLEEPGLVRHVGSEPTIVLGEWDSRPSPRATGVHDTLAAAGVSVLVPDDIDAEIWRKFAFVVSLGGVGAVTRAPAGPTRSHPVTRAMIREGVREVASVARARGVAVAADLVDSALRFIDSLPEEGSTSLQRDIAAGRPSELEAWTGAVVRLGGEEGVPTPTHSAIYGSLVLLEERARGRLSFDVPGERPGGPGQL